MTSRTRPSQSHHAVCFVVVIHISAMDEAYTDDDTDDDTDDNSDDVADDDDEVT